MNTEPKFKVGDVVVRKAFFIQEIACVGRSQYFTKNFCNKDGSYCDSCIDFEEQHLWTLKQQEITITKEQLAKAWDNIAAKVHRAVIPSHESPIFKALCKELGFK